MIGPPVLFLPIVEWSFRVQRPHHLARCFARAGYRVFYPDLRLSAAPRPPWLIESGIWRLGLAGDPAHDPYRDRLPWPAVERAITALRAMTEEHSLTGCWLVVQLPSWRPLAEALREAFAGHLLFDCVDEYAAFSDHAALSAEEVGLARSADLVVAVTEPLRRKLAQLGARCVLVRNACEPEHFGPAAARVRGGGPPVVGFFGGIHDWFDSRLLAELASARREWEFWLVGDTYLAEIEPLHALGNVYFLGELAYRDLPRVVSHFDVGIIPFKISPLTQVAETVKVYEMLAAGLPVVASDLPELRRLAPLVAVAASAQGFAERIEEALAAPPSAAAARREFARANSWLERFLELRRAMEDACRASPDTAGAARRIPPSRLLLGLPEHQRENAELENERRSLIEQRDRVQAEASRLASELARVEGERLRLDHELRQVTASNWWRLGAPLRALRRRLRG
ncbi:MAG TPA: glycosyltransferase [Thermoanaerobaculia bacterium]|nr:glycosyltransferase [Thermoanaerobaculia bacterium]